MNKKLILWLVVGVVFIFIAILPLIMALVQVSTDTEATGLETLGTRNLIRNY